MTHEAFFPGLIWPYGSPAMPHTLVTMPFLGLQVLTLSYRIARAREISMRGAP
jgi:hypothetical protein